MKSQLGPDGCAVNVTISMSGDIFYIPPGTVCMRCSVGGEVASDAVFQINGSSIVSSEGRVVDGVLVVNDSESVFNTAKRVQCITVSLNGNHSALISIFTNGKSYYTILIMQELCIHMNYSNHWEYHPQ